MPNEEVSVRRSRDYKLLTSLMQRDARVWEWMVDDYCPAPSQFRTPENERVWYLLVEVNDQPAGFIAVVEVSAVLGDMHFAIMPEWWGKGIAVLAMKKAMRILWEAGGFLRIMSSIPDDNAHAVRFLAQAGFEEFGINKASFKRRGKLVDQHMFGISLPSQGGV